jgi:hypothetical protein
MVRTIRTTVPLVGMLMVLGLPHSLRAQAHGTAFPSVSALSSSDSAAEQFLPLATAHRDMTGDGVEETLRLVGWGDPSGHLWATFSIESAGGILYEDEFELSRTAGFEPGDRGLGDEEWGRRVDWHSAHFFDEEQFWTWRQFRERRGPPTWGGGPPPFELIETQKALAAARKPRPLEVGGSDRARAIEEWNRVVASGVPLFFYAPPGSRAAGLVWSREHQRFFDILPMDPLEFD